MIRVLLALLWLVGFVALLALAVRRQRVRPEGLVESNPEPRPSGRAGNLRVYGRALLGRSATKGQDPPVAPDPYQIALSHRPVDDSGDSLPSRHAEPATPIDATIDATLVRSPHLSEPSTIDEERHQVPIDATLDAASLNADRTMTTPVVSPSIKAPGSDVHPESGSPPWDSRPTAQASSVTRLPPPSPDRAGATRVPEVSATRIPVRVVTEEREAWAPADAETVMIGSAADAAIRVPGEERQAALVFSDGVPMVTRLSDGPLALGEVKVGAVGVPVTATSYRLRLAHADVDLSGFLPRQAELSLVVQWKLAAGPAGIAQLGSGVALVAGAGQEGLSEAIASCFSGVGARSAVWALDAVLTGRSEPVAACVVGVTRVGRSEVVVAAATGVEVQAHEILSTGETRGVDVAAERDDLMTVTLGVVGTARLDLSTVGEGEPRPLARAHISLHEPPLPPFMGGDHKESGDGPQR